MTRKTRLALLAAVAAIPLSAPLANAQYLLQERNAQLNVNPRGLDANNRVGSQGYNSPGNQLPPAQVTGNQIVTRNVTGGREFRGTINYRDANEFRGNLATSTVDSFIRNSVGSPGFNQPMVIPGQSTAFYPTFSKPPAGFGPQGFTGTFTPIQTPSPTIGPSASLRLPPLDSRMPQLVVGNNILPNPVDPLTNLPRVLTPLDLLSLRANQPQEWSDRALLSRYSGVGRDSLSRMQLDEATLHRMRQDLTQPIGTPEAPKPNEPAKDSLNLNRSMPQPMNAPINANMAARPLGDNLAAQPLTSQVRGTFQAVPEAQPQGQITLVPWQQSEQYKEMARRTEDYYREWANATKNAEALRKLPPKAAEPTDTGTGEAATTPRPGGSVTGGTPGSAVTGGGGAGTGGTILRAPSIPPGVEYDDMRWSSAS